MEAFLVSTGAVAIAEIGDKTQLLAFVLAARFRKPVPIIAGILVATLFNHSLAGALGTWLMTVIGPTPLRWILGLSFLAMAAWTLIPDKVDDDATPPSPTARRVRDDLCCLLPRRDGRQDAVGDHRAGREVRRAGRGDRRHDARHDDRQRPRRVPGERLLTRVPMRLVHIGASALFVALGVATLFGVGARFGF
jgi:putative Ca2+/H+ antiporter (TMEM165/GDT1 family)